MVSTAGGAQTTRMTTLAGTVEDQTSTGTPSGMDSNSFRVAIKRMSNSYWWNGSTWTAPTGALYEPANSVLIGAGTGVKSWTLTLSSTFYDLLGATETFKVYTYGKDQSNNPPGSAHEESSTTPKLAFSYHPGTATLAGIVPENASAVNALATVNITLNPQGGRVDQAWVVFMDTHNYFWTGSSWTTVAVADPPPPTFDNLTANWLQGQVWLTTTAVPGYSSPDLIFTPGSTPDGLSVLSASFTAATTHKIPTWTDGRKYKIYVRARNADGQRFDTFGTHSFFYDTTIPTLAGHASITGLSNNPGNYSWAQAIAVASGTILDNVSDIGDVRQVFLRIYDEDAGKYLNPNTLIKFDWSDQATAWSRLDTTADAWSFDLTVAQFVSGNKYKVELYAQDAAGNRQDPGCPVALETDPNCQTGSATIPKYRRYLRLDKVKPTVAIATPTVTNPNYIGGKYNLAMLSGTSADSSGEVSYVEFALKASQNDPTNHWQHHVSSGEWKANSVGDIWNRVYPQDPAWAVWTSSNIVWFESEQYELKLRSVDKAGNVSNEVSQIFLYDKAMPLSVVTAPVLNQRYTSQLLAIQGTAVDDTSTSTGTSSGLYQDFGVAIIRQSDNYWWNGSTWVATRSTMTVAIAQGTGIKTWSLPLNSTFYDLLQVNIDTFNVYGWAQDLSNNPATNCASIESSFTAKSTYSSDRLSPTQRDLPQAASSSAWSPRWPSASTRWARASSFVWSSSTPWAT